MCHDRFAPSFAAVLLLAPLVGVASASVADPSLPSLERERRSLTAPEPIAADARLRFVDHRITDGMQLDLEHSLDYTLDVDVTLTILTLRGRLQIGVAGALRRALDAHPHVTGIELDSDGGNVYQARALASLVLTHELDTYVRDHCHSACTLVFVAGARRFLAADASIGFHCYRLAPSVAARPGIDPVAEQVRDARFFAERIPDETFAEKIFRCSAPELWLPAAAELLDAGVVHEILPD